MNKDKQARLEAAGWRIGSAAEFLDLTPEETALVEIRLALSQQLRALREGRVTQAELAARMGSSQPRIAKAEAGERSVSLDLLVRALLALGVGRREIGDAIAGVVRSKRRAAARPARLAVREVEGTYLPSATVPAGRRARTKVKPSPRQSPEPRSRQPAD